MKIELLVKWWQYRLYFTEHLTIIHIISIDISIKLFKKKLD